jgi:RNase H-like domain found in reverse transcriptase
MQDRRFITFISQELDVKHQRLSTYENEFIVLIIAVSKWKHYLIGSSFIIKTDQINLKHLLEQEIYTTLQHRGLSKLLGFDYTIEYKKDIDNKVADAFSRTDEFSNNSLCITVDFTSVFELEPQWITDI